MYSMQTKPAPAATELNTTAPCVPGTIGFDLYLSALALSRDALKAPRTPAYNATEGLPR